MVKLAYVAAAVLALAASSAQAATLRELVRGSLENLNQVEGTQNCQNKCQNLLGYLSYWTAVQQQQTGQGNNEYRACILGCERCNAQLAGNQPKETCFDYCKSYNYAGATPQIQKGVIEPDKACIIGCVIQLCQGLCSGNGQWSSNDGCQIQSGYGIQTYSLEPRGNTFATCCVGLQNTCLYQGPTTNNPNFDKIVRATHKICDGSTLAGLTINSGTDIPTMCAAYQRAYTNGNECAQPIT